MINFEEIKKDIATAPGRVKTGRVVAHVIINLEALDGMTNYEVAEKFGLMPSACSDISRARAAGKQLGVMGYEVRS